MEKQLKEAKKKADEAATLLVALELEIARTLLGQSNYSNETLSKMIETRAATERM